VGTTSSMHLLMKPMTDVVYSSMPSDESLNIFQSVLAKQSCSLTCLSTCPSDKEVTENVVLLFDARNHFTYKNASLCLYHYYRESEKLCYHLPTGYLAYSSLSQIQHGPFKTKEKALYLTRFSKMSRNEHFLCSCRKQSLPRC
jgi:hypothetical protein